MSSDTEEDPTDRETTPTLLERPEDVLEALKLQFSSANARTAYREIKRSDVTHSGSPDHSRTVRLHDSGGYS